MSTKPKFNIDIHPAAALFPMLSDDELKELAKSIVDHGLREKIHAIPQAHDDRTDWLIIDGRNRLAALRFIGVKDEEIVANYLQPVNLEALGNATPEEYVMMANIERRNLTQAQRRALAGKLAIMIAEQQKDKPKEEQVDSLAEAAKKAGVSRRTAATAKKMVSAGTTPRKPSKTKAKAPVPMTVTGWLKNARDAILKSGHNWPDDRRREAYVFASDIIQLLATGDEDARAVLKEMLSDHVPVDSTTGQKR